jgi:hypothetical protein
MAYQAGGRITITLGGARYSPRGKAVIDSSGVANSAVANHDGTVVRTTNAKPVGAELTFDRGNASANTARPKWNTAFMLQFVNVTIAEIDTGVLHTFSNATIVGQPKIDTETGEVSGLSIMTDDSNYVQSTT